MFWKNLFKHNEEIYYRSNFISYKDPEKVNKKERIKPNISFKYKSTKREKKNTIRINSIRFQYVSLEIVNFFFPKAK